MLDFYFDHHVHSAIFAGLRKRGIDVLTAFDDGFDERDDESLLVRSAELGRVLVTYDLGFLSRASRWQHADRVFPGIVFGIQDRVVIGTAVRYLEDLATRTSAATIANSVVYLPSKFPP